MLRRITRGEVPADHVASLHDPLAIACLVEPRLVTVEPLPVAVSIEDGDLRTRVDPAAELAADVVTDVDAVALRELVMETLIAGR